MGRKEIERSVLLPPLFNDFKPAGVAGKHLHYEVLSLDEYEAIRLVDYNEFSHEQASEEMGVSRPVFTKMLEKARKKISLMFVKGYGIRIEGGNVHFKRNILKCNDCGQMFDIKISDEIVICPNCESNTIVNVAGGFGHGRCCNNHNRR